MISRLAVGICDQFLVAPLVSTYHSFHDKGKTAERRRRKATIYGEILMIAGLPVHNTSRLWAPDKEIIRAFPAFSSRFVADGLTLREKEARRT
jgi:hypothetical protein